jgi:hypothetical protein
MACHLRLHNYGLTVAGSGITTALKHDHGKGVMGVLVAVQGISQDICSGEQVVIFSFLQ